MIRIKNASVYTNGSFEKKDVFVEDGKISFIGGGLATTIDAEGKKLIPGFIDIHIHGAVGCDFNDGTPEAIEKITTFMASHGTTSIVATTSTVSAETIKRAVGTATYKMKNGTNGANIIGSHLEGPFFSPRALGAQNPEFVQAPSVEALDSMTGENRETVKMVAVAPECEGAIGLIDELVKRNIVAAIGHTCADYDCACMAIEHGATMMTHFYNAMTPLKHREPGVIGAAFEKKNVKLQLICDFIHVHPAAVKIAINTVGEDNVILITDAIAGTGLGDGKYNLGGLDVYVSNGVARIKEGNLAGSTLTLDKALRNMMKIGYPIESCIKFLSENPAKAMGVADRKGFIEEGYDADMILLDENNEVTHTIVNGKVVFKK